MLLVSGGAARLLGQPFVPQNNLVHLLAGPWALAVHLLAEGGGVVVGGNIGLEELAIAGGLKQLLRDCEGPGSGITR